MDAGRVLLLLPKPLPVSTVTSADVPMTPGELPNLPVIPNVNRNLPDAPVVNESRIELTTPKPVGILNQEEITTTITRKSSRKELLSLEHQIIIDDDQIDAAFNDVGIDFSQVAGNYILYFIF